MRLVLQKVLCLAPPLFMNQSFFLFLSGVTFTTTAVFDTDLLIHILSEIEDRLLLRTLGV